MMDQPTDRQFPKPNPTLEPLQILIGQWETEGFHPMLPAPVRGRASFEWMMGGAFIVWHSFYEKSLPPSGVAVIGRDDSGDNDYCMLYYDERGVSRIYAMSLENEVWKLWRNSPGFSQRMTGAFSPDHTIISVHGEMSHDGSTWEQDLDLKYTKVR